MKQQKNKQRGKKGQSRGQGKPPVVPWYSPPQTAKQARHIAAAGAKSEYLPVERTIKSNLRASNQRIKDDGRWWGEYLNTVSGVQADTANAYANAATQQQGFVNQANAADNANTARLNAEEASSAALRGQTPSTAPSQTAAAAQAQRNYLSAAQGGANAARGANQYAYLGEQKRIGAGQSVKSRMDEQKRGLGIRQDLAASRKERAAKATSDYNTIRENAAARALEKWKTNVAFSENKAGLKADAQQSAYDRALANRQQAETERHNRADERNSAADNGNGPTPKERREHREDKKAAYQTAVSLANEGQPVENEYGHVTGYREWPSWEALESALRKESEITPGEAHWAVQKLKQRKKRQAQQQRQEAIQNPVSGGNTGPGQGGMHR